MALANVAWILASNGKRVLTVDWDLEAPGLHRYFQPFMVDKDLTSSEGILDLVLDYSMEAITPPENENNQDEAWYLPQANILRYAASLKWQFPPPGRLDFVPAGKQIPSYASRMNSFDWRNFYERLGGGAFLEALKVRMREEYDYVLIDSRTGVSDTSGICTVQMPDALVVCFTLNNQGIDGAAAVANSVYEQRGKYGILIYPVPMRLEVAEKEKLDFRLKYAQSMFGKFPIHLPSDDERGHYLEEVQFPYIPYYAYEEILATFGDTPGKLNTVLAASERLTTYLTDGEVRQWTPPSEGQRQDVLVHYQGTIGSGQKLEVIPREAKDSADETPSKVILEAPPTRSSSSTLDTVFFSYSHKDEKLAYDLVNHLSNLKRQGVIRSWHDRMVSPGGDWRGKIDEQLNSAKLILLLVSPDFVASDYCYDVEVKRALELSEAGQARVIPVILRPVDWEGSPFGKLQALPTDAKPVTTWANFDEAFFDIAKGIRRAVEQIAQTENLSLTSAVNIPRPPITGFVARRDRKGKDIVNLLKEQVAPSQNQLIALWGPGGVGKTTLAAETARALSQNFSNRVIWISSESRADFNFPYLLDEIATQLARPDLRRLAPEPKEEQILALIASAPLLIVIDNFETIALEEQKHCVNWLAHRSVCSVLITTRQRIDGVRNIAIDAMSLDEAHDFLDRLVEETAATSVFTQDVRNQIIQSATANPYLMLWVVAQIDLAQEPSTVLEDLEQGIGDAAERVFDRSFNLPQVGDDGRATLLALSLFVAGASRLALSEVAGFRDDLKRLGNAIKRLRSLWLAQGFEGNERLATVGLTRSLARARLSKDVHADDYYRRFIDYFSHYVKAHDRPTPEDYSTLEIERDNILSAIDLAFGINDWKTASEISYKIANPVSGMLSIHGFWDEAMRRNKQSLAAARKASDERLIAAFTHNVAVFQQMRGELFEAQRLYSESLEISRNFNERPNMASTLRQLGSIAREQGDLMEAQQLFNESLEISNSLGDRNGVANTMHQLGRLAYEQGDFEEAQRLYNESLVTTIKLGNQRGIANTLFELGILAHNQDNLAEARSLYHESLEISKKLGDQDSIANTIMQLGQLAQNEGKRAEATVLFNNALSIFERLKSPLAEKTRRLLEASHTN
jgi:tetratricopeptide (TPR) repeat protein/MinD-like ATPase involved in chromosome partitioning or flagellar assembly